MLWRSCKHDDTVANDNNCILIREIQRRVVLRWNYSRRGCRGARRCGVEVLPVSASGQRSIQRHGAVNGMAFDGGNGDDE